LAGRRTAALQRSDRTRGLLVTADIDGIVQGIALDIGQSVGAYQMLGRIVEPDRLKAVLRIPEVQVRDVIAGQSPAVDTRLGLVPGRVARVDPSVAQGTVAVDIDFDEPHPQGVRPDLGVDGVIEIERIDKVLRVGRPTSAGTDRTIRIFRLTPDGTEAERVEVAVGRTSIGTVEILRGLQEGDVIILSDMSEWADHDRIRLR
jgi:multidrug efflux pump subunit AcrA (membrane-fusion protein)